MSWSKEQKEILLKYQSRKKVYWNIRAERKGGTPADVDGTGADVDVTAVKVDCTSVKVDCTSVKVDCTAVKVDCTAVNFDCTAVKIDAIVSDVKDWFFVSSNVNSIFFSISELLISVFSTKARFVSIRL